MKGLRIVFLMIMLTAAFAFTPQPMYWHGMSVSTSDNVGALSLNPAGLGIVRGEQSSFLVQLPENDDEDPTYFLGKIHDVPP